MLDATSDSERLERLVERAQRDTVAYIASVLAGNPDLSILTNLRDALMLRDPNHAEKP